jgi:hypothetical protein
MKLSGFQVWSVKPADLKRQKVKKIKDIENHLERCDARFERFKKIEAIREKIDYAI